MTRWIVRTWEDAPALCIATLIGLPALAIALTIALVYITVYAPHYLLCIAIGVVFGISTGLRR